MDCQAPLSVEFSRQEYWKGLPFPTPGGLPNPGTEKKKNILIFGNKIELPKVHTLGSKKHDSFSAATLKNLFIKMITQ